MEINYLNLKRMYNHILLNVPQEKIDMSVFRFRNDDKGSHMCNSVGCVIGHCTILDDFENIPLDYDGNIIFTFWSNDFTGMNHKSEEWRWCFSGEWCNDKVQILLRIKYLIEKETAPRDWGNGWGYNYNYLLPVKELEPYELD